jgi:hypothetical protein
VLALHNCKHVLLGHNNDDVVENIIMNIRKCEKFSCLDGMEEQSNELGVSIIRPFLALTKKQIKQYAAKKSLAYMQNSTPAWSMRGQIRKELNTSKVFNDDFVKGLTVISDTLKTIHAHYKKIVYAIPITNESTATPLIISIPFSSLIDDYAFFAILFARIAEEYSIPYISKKAICDFQSRYKMQTKIQINTNLTILGGGAPQRPQLG